MAMGVLAETGVEAEAEPEAEADAEPAVERLGAEGLD